MKSLQKEQYYDPQSAGINMQTPQSDSTPWSPTAWINSEINKITNKLKGISQTLKNLHANKPHIDIFFSKKYLKKMFAHKF